MGSQQQFCLRWNNHQSNMVGVFDNLLQSEYLVDVTLACEGLSLKAHKVVLSACSPFFQNLFLDNPCKHPIVILKDVKFSDLRALIDFMYRGEVNVSQDQLSALLATAETLKVKGLAEVTSGMNGNGDNSSTPPSGGAPSTIIPDDLTRRGSPSAKRKRIRVRRRSGGGGSGVSDTEDEIHEVSHHSHAPMDMVEAKVEINENNYTPCSQMSDDHGHGGGGVGGQDHDGVTSTPSLPITTASSMDLSPVAVSSENVLAFGSGSGSDIAVINETNVTTKGTGGSSGGVVTVATSSELARRPKPNLPNPSSTSLPLLNLQLPTPLPSTSGMQHNQQNPPSGQESQWYGAVCPITSSKRRNPMIIVDGFRFQINKIRQPRHYWRCADRHCPARATTILDMERQHRLSSGSPLHNHVTLNIKKSSSSGGTSGGNSNFSNENNENIEKSEKVEKNVEVVDKEMH